MSTAEKQIELYTWYHVEKSLKNHLDSFKELPPWAKKRNIKDLDSLRLIYINRIVYEFSIIKKMGFCGYFLIVADGIRFCQEKGIPTGPGRGSASGCLLSFLLDITKVDPIKYNLLFERFLNPERFSMPDIDSDFSQARRGEVKDYYTEKYGRDHVASVGTFSRMKVRAAIKDVVRSLNLGGNPGESFRLADKISKTLDDEDPDITYADALAASEDFANYMERYPEVADHIKKCENILRQMSMHAAALLISAKPLDEELPLVVDKKGMVLTAYDGKTCEGLGYLKLDTLGLKNLDIIKACRDNIKQTRGFVPEMELDGIEIDPTETDQQIEKRIAELESEELRLASNTYKFFREGISTLGIFQCEQNVTQDLLKRGRTNSIQDIADILAGIRPGPRKAGSTDLYISRKRGEVPIDYVFEQTHQYDPETQNYDGFLLEEPLIHDLTCISEICDETQGLPFFQEQLMRISTRVAGFSVGGSDVLRKGVGKKDAKLIAEIGRAFIEGCKGNRQERLIQGINVFKDSDADLNPDGLPEETAEYLWYKFILPYGSYGFNLSHSISYALISYETAWLKANFPGEFYAALLSYESDQDKINTIISEAKIAGIRFLPPDVNKSTNNFAIVDPTTIVYSLTCMKGVGDKAVEKIIEHRPYTNMVDFLGRCPVNSSVTGILIKSGAFENTFETEDESRKNYYDFYKDCKTKLKRQTDRLLRDKLLKKVNFVPLKGEEKKKAEAEGTFESAAKFHKRMLEEDQDYLAEYQKGCLEEINNFVYDWSGPITITSKGVAESVPRMSEDERSHWTSEEKFDFEDEIFGTVLSGHRLDPYKQFENAFIQNVERHNMSHYRLSDDLTLFQKDQEVLIFCQGLRFLRKSPYKKDPSKYTRFFEIEDRMGKARITVFDQSFKYLLKNKPMNPLTILAKNLPYRPVMVIKCKVNEYNNSRSLVFDSLVDWVNETQIKEQFRAAKLKEMQK